MNKLKARRKMIDAELGLPTDTPKMPEYSDDESLKKNERE
jgi:hypothetical protein